jgi:hypothetical protein
LARRKIEKIEIKEKNDGCSCSTGSQIPAKFEEKLEIIGISSYE